VQAISQRDWPPGTGAKARHLEAYIKPGALSLFQNCVSLYTRSAAMNFESLPLTAASLLS
jgi:hypothetical protein